MNVPSTTHSLSTHVAPALVQSSFTLAYDVIRRPFTIPELIGTQAAWQIAATILESRSIVRTKSRTSLCRRSRSGPATPPGMITASNSFASRALTVVSTSHGYECFEAYVRFSCPARVTSARRKEVAWMSQNTNTLPVHPAILDAIRASADEQEFNLYPRKAGVVGLSEAIKEDLRLEDVEMILTNGGIEGEYIATRALLK